MPNPFCFRNHNAPSGLLFLDIDGVLNTLLDDEAGLLTGRCVDELKRVLLELPDLRIVISSTWREKFGLFRLGWVWRQYDLSEHWVIDRTPVKLFDSRGIEILSWIEETAPLLGIKPDVHFAVLEDEPAWIFPDIPKENAFICNPEKGLTKRIANRLIRFLK